MFELFTREGGRWALFMIVIVIVIVVVVVVVVVVVLLLALVVVVVLYDSHIEWHSILWCGDKSCGVGWIGSYLLMGSL